MIVKLRFYFIDKAQDSKKPLTSDCQISTWALECNNQQPTSSSVVILTLTITTYEEN